MPYSGTKEERRAKQKAADEKLRENNPERFAAIRRDAVKRYRAKNNSDPEYRRKRSKQSAASSERARQRDPEGYREKVRKNMARWRANNPERALQNQRDWQRNNREKTRCYVRKWRERNADWCRDYLEKWRKKHPERWKELQKRYYVKYRKDSAKVEIQREAIRRSYWKHLEKSRARLREAYHANPQATLHRNHKRRAIFYGAFGSHTHEQWLDRVMYYGLRCRYCGIELVLQRYQSNTLTKDHVIPLSCGGTNWASNLVPACSSCNKSKHDDNVKSFLNRKKQERCEGERDSKQISPPPDRRR